MSSRPLDALDAEAVRQWLGATCEALRARRDEIDDLNVYPVPDGDTGTNLLLTVEAAAAEVEQHERTAALCDVVEAMARGALLGARGNSGVILSQILRGLADVVASDGGGTAHAVRRGLQRGAELAYQSVANPVEGTLLTVAREAAEALRSLDADDLAAVVRGARAAADDALARTPELLPQLRAAGVVDAGGRGLCVVLEALEWTVAGAAAGSAAGTGSGATPPTQPVVPRDRSGIARVREAGSDEYAYEVQYLLQDTDESAVERLKRTLAELGDSLVVVGRDELFNVHVHVNDVGAAIEAGIEAGRPSRITVTRFADQMVEGQPKEADGRAVVAVAPSDGLAELFREAGAVVVAGGPTNNPSTGQLLQAIRSSGAAEVVLLPNDGNALAVAAAAADAARDDGLVVAVVPTRSVVQGLAALAVADAARPFPDDVAGMAQAAGSTRWAEVTVAVRDAMTSAGVCRAGDVLGLLEGDVVLIGRDVEEVATSLVDRMLDGGGELVTVVTGERAPEGVADRLTEHVCQTRPAVEVVAYDGGQPHYPLLLAVE